MTGLDFGMMVRWVAACARAVLTAVGRSTRSVGEFLHDPSGQLAFMRAVNAEVDALCAQIQRDGEAERARNAARRTLES